MVSSPRIDFNSLRILKGDLSATFADPFELITINLLNGDQPAKGDTLIKLQGSTPATEPNQGDTLRGTPAQCQGLPWSYTPSRGCETSPGIDSRPMQRKMTSRLGSVGQRCSPVSGERSGQGGMLMSDSHYCRAVTTSTSRIHPSPYTGRTSRQTRRPHCGGAPLNYSQHRRATVNRSRGWYEEKWTGR
ncbi:hypothetical protein PoB_005099600 [Plakobranchus ocellatus]|uniref:Uncharacterized protein n=1 Tax=Plakobranchus ocellatus TaxID=259542 RepID=A0AAV4BMH5_9GAST|nr:hypothetical protein PoB_005099600 [Plakobranchus ocellatus]